MKAKAHRGIGRRTGSRTCYPSEVQMKWISSLLKERRDRGLLKSRARPPTPVLAHFSPLTDHYAASHSCLISVCVAVQLRV